MAGGAVSRTDATASNPRLRTGLLFRDPSAAQTRKIGRLGQRSDLRLVEPDGLLHASEAGIAQVQSLRLGELRPRAFGVALERVTRCKIGMHKGQSGILAIGFFEPGEG